jgi:GNAT superfamily N-acetyltransferase
MSELTVRAAVAADLEPLLVLYDHLHGPHDRPADPAAHWPDVLGHPGQTVFVAALPTGELVASCTLVVIPQMLRGGAPYALIENVVTHAGHRKRGHGTALLHAAFAAAWDAGCYKVMLMTGSTDPATHRFYADAGFEQSKTGYQIRRPGY